MQNKNNILIYAFFVTNCFGADWTEIGSSTAMIGENMTDRAGASVALSADGKTVAFGQPGWSTVTGRVEIFKFNGSNWVQVGSSIDGETAGDSAGTSVALSSNGQMVAVGEPGWNTTGRVRIFKFDGSNWTLVGLAIDGESLLDSAGNSVTLSSDGQTVAIGEPGWNIATGRVRVYKFNGSNWIQVGNSINGENITDFAGFSVSLSANGKTIAFGEPYWENGSGKGRVRVYKFDGNDWLQIGDAMNGENASDFTGLSISLSADGKTIAFGEPYWENGNQKGRVRVYRFDGSNWIQLGNSIDGENLTDRAGASVALSANGKMVAFGEPIWINANEIGRVRIYKFDGNNWIQVGNAISGENVTDQAGSSVSLSSKGKIVAFGEPAWVNGNEKGRVRIYENPYGTQDTTLQNQILKFKPLNLSNLANHGATLENMVPVYYLYSLATKKSSL
ncbi:hypothetical protein HYV10_03365 [Candidatus Dependentiae bacterium]|nr:hypothetical protein [Candidatus Dependentiae bacterium]